MMRALVAELAKSFGCWPEGRCRKSWRLPLPRNLCGRSDRKDRLARQAHEFVVVTHSPLAKLVKSFGLLGNATESLDDFRYAGVGYV